MAPPTLNQMIYVDSLSMNIQKIAIHRREDCAVCGSGQRRLKMMKKLVITVLFLSLGMSVQAEEGFTSLFDGKNVVRLVACAGAERGRLRREQFWARVPKPKSGMAYC